MIIVIGSINLDLIATMDRLPTPGETVSGHDFKTAPGGKGANQALAAARAGQAVRLIGATGRDGFAEQALTLLEVAGVDLSKVRRSGTATGTALILVDSNGENMITVVPGANAELGTPDVEDSGIGKGDFVLLQHEVPLEIVIGSLEQARDRGAVSLLNTAPFDAEAAPYLGMADIVIANETEFDLHAALLKLDGCSREDKMTAFARHTGRTLVVTLGSEGLLAIHQSRFISMPSLPVDAIDTVGAGDTFCGYLAAGLASGSTMEVALERAAIAASLACMKPGAQPAIPNSDAVDAAHS